MNRGKPSVVALLCVGVLVAAGCSSGSDGQESGPSSTSTSRAKAVRRPAGPAATVTEITAAGTPFVGEGTAPDLEAVGYEQLEYVASGTATAYSTNGPLTADGQWTFSAAESAPYRTRVLVRRPAAAKDFSGTVVVEWLNVSGGLDANPDWTSLHEDLVRNGDVWVGVSAQRIGIMGGPVLVGVPGVGDDLVGKGLRVIDPARYETLDHPGDGFAFDMYTQVARAVRSGEVLGGLEPQWVIGAGESQSAIALVTYVNGVQPLTNAFDGFFVHSRAAFALPLVGPGESADLIGAFGGESVIFRTDQPVPVLELQSESDVAGVLNSAAARQPDTDRFRLWEVAGTAHADRHLIGSIADTLDCGVPINDGPMHVVAKAAFRALVDWVEQGRPPPRMPRLTLAAGDAVAIERDAAGIARGGIRTPPVDVPVAVLSGAPGPDPATICLLLGSTTPISEDALATRYASADAYGREYRDAIAAAVKAGVVLPADRKAIADFADPAALSG